MPAVRKAARLAPGTPCPTGCAKVKISNRHWATLVKMVNPHDKSSNDWFLWRDVERSPFDNMAVDEALLRYCGSIDRPLLRIYGWDRPSLSIGYFQRYRRDFDDKLSIVRRPTGGGLVDHRYDLTYSLIVPAVATLYNTRRCDSYRVIHQALILALDELGIRAQLMACTNARSASDPAALKCFDSPSNHDVMSNHLKIAGGAQKRSRSGFLHQGSLNTSRIVDISRDELAERIQAGFARGLGCRWRNFIAPQALIEAAKNLSATKYAVPTWNQKR